MAKKTVIRELSIYINDREVINSMAGITRSIGQTNNEIKNLNKNSATYDQDLKKLKETLSQLKEKQAEFKEEIQDTAITAEMAKEKFDQIFTGLSTGNLAMVKEGLTGIKAALIGVLKTTMAFIATPLGATIAVLAGIALAAKEWYNYNAQALETNKILAGLTKQSGDALDAIRVRTTAISETFGKEMEETVSAANVLVNEFGLTFDQALDEIEQGLIKGGSANKEYFESLSEYATFFAQAGYSVEEFRSIVQAGFDLGIYSDKLPDAVKEFTLSITEQTKASRDALNNAFGEEFTGKLLKGVKDGSISAKEALEQISKEAEKIGLNSQQAQQLTADLFRGAGEDAGGALKIFKAVNQSYADQGRELTSLEKTTQELLEAQKELAEAQDGLLKSDGFAEWSAGWDLAMTKIKAGFYNMISYMVNSKEEIEKLANINAENDNLKRQKEFYEQDHQNYINARKKRLGEAFDLEKETNDRIKMIQDWMEDPTKSAEQLKQYQWQIDSIKRVTSERIASLNVSKKASLDELADAKKAADEKAKLAKKAADDKKKADEEAKKNEEDRLKALLNAQIRVSKAQLDYFIAFNRSKIDSEKKLTEELVAEEVRRSELIKEKQLESLEADYRRKLDAAEKEKLSAQELILLKEAINLEYFTAQQNLELAFQEGTYALKEEFELQKKEEKAEQMALEDELRLAEAASKYEEEKIQEEQRYKAELSRYIKLFEDKKITEEQFNRFVAALDEKSEELKAKRRLADIATMLGAMNQLAGALGEMFGQSKELAILQANISGAQAILSIWAAPAMMPQPYDGILKGVLTAASAITTASQLNNIRKQKAPKTPKFFYGGNTGSDPALGYDQFGAVTGVVHKNEWVAPEIMTANPKYAATFGWLENERKKIMNNGFVDGGSTSPNGIPEITTNSDNSNDDIASVLRDLRTILSSGIMAKVFFGYQEAEEIEKLNKERSDSNQNGIIS